MPNRIIKESICTSANLDALTWFSEVLFYRLIVNCDDFGRFDGRAEVLKSKLFPLKRNITLKNIRDAVLQLESAGLIVPYIVDGQPFLHLPTWSRHQRSRYSAKYPAPPEFDAQRLTAAKSGCPSSPCSPLLPPTPPIITPLSPNSVQSARKELPTPMVKRAPAREDVAAFVEEKGLMSVDPDAFFEHYNAVGWEGVRCWKALIIEWDKRDEERINRLLEQDAEAFDRIRNLNNER